ncbi:regulatory protein RecX [Hespellia stercorisuis]|uniref:Regulatory protein RecX n=1 Tax=Hespellia stercorisuis DSM 15480 TaxID=1121950 RepID=A0A1M6NQZ5_9FIRM|nr:regulatory protein RecX [Hespellia stercorisuis]SHJ98139.1 regulatory protein [Hespellia stercorisuis DSM 15480]
MQVTKIEPVTKSKYKVFVDEQFAFVLYKGELSRYHIRAEEELEESLFYKIKNEVILKRAKLRAMHLLNDMDRTESALRTKLKLGLYTEDIIDQAVQYVKSFGYIDDYRYAVHFIDIKKDSKSRREIYAALVQKGVASESIDLAFEETYDTGGEQQAIREIIRKRRVDLSAADEGEIRKLYGYLARKGFKYDDIRQVVQYYNENA